MGPTRRLNESEKAKRTQEREVLDKDESETRLEKILFGDQAGFFTSLNDAAAYEHKALQRIEDSGEENGSNSFDDNDDDEDLKEVPDEDLFFLDAGTIDLPQDLMQDLRIAESGSHNEEHSRKVLWHDSGDERIMVSLASNSRLRKLRDTKDDDIVNGLEYIRRLRRQYERLHPPPEWVKYARKKRRLSSKENEDSDTDSDASLDGSASIAAKPLADLLRSTASLVRTDTKATDGPSHPLRLRPETIDIQRLKDVASTGPSSIDTIQFHLSYPLLLTAGPSSTINLYHVSPFSLNPNPLVTSLHVKGTPITSAIFALSPNKIQNTSANKDEQPETKIYFSARRRYFHTWSLNDGVLTKISRPLYSNSKNGSASITKKSRKNHEMPTTERLILSPNSEFIAIIANTGSSGGVVHVLSSATHQPICQCRIDGLNGIAEVAFWRDSNGFSVVGKNGEVSEFNLAERCTLGRWMDEGAVGTTTLALGGEIRDSTNRDVQTFGKDRYVAIGSTSGIVNIYDRIPIIARLRSTLIKSTGNDAKGGTVSANNSVLLRPKPLRTLDQLTTPISHLKFSSDAAGQMLVMASRWKKNALRLVHLPSATVYRNWPTDRTPLGRVSSVAISFDGRYLVVGNEAGKVRLWQIRD